MPFTVRIKFSDGREEIMENITEIHYNFPSIMLTELGTRIAFESDIDATGSTHRMCDIVEFEAIENKLI